MEKNYDFSGWATKADLLCSDGRIIRKNAFEHCDGMKVPLVWNHQHNDPDRVLGHAMLENRDEGVYAYCYFNETESGQTAKLCVQHGDIDKLSIWANKLKHQGRDVIHGMIREVSLVHCGANPGAYIDTVLMHSDDSSEEGTIHSGEFIDYVAPSLAHADEKDEKGDTAMAEETKKPETAEAATEEKEETVQDVFDTFTEKQKTVVYALIGQALEEAEGSKEEVKHADSENEEDDGEETVADVFNSMSEKQKTVVYAIIGQALEEKEGGEEDMKHNVFNQEEEAMEMDVLSHAEMEEIFESAKRNKGSLKDEFLAHGITDIGELFPDHKTLTNEPEFIKRNDDWVAKVLGGVHHSPFARIKTVFADITAADARAKGYTKGNLKIEEVFRLLKRVTNPTTVYKKQKLDRDDVLDIQDINILPWLKGELRMMLDEELARAYLIGDGRDPVTEADDKINEECIRPIWKMEDLFTVKAPVVLKGTETDEEKAKLFIKACVKSRKNYQGSGSPSMFMSEDLLTDCLLIEDATGRVIYDTIEKLAARLRVKEIIPVPVMADQKRTGSDDKVYTLGGIYVNLKDYNVGTNKGGEITMFDDFDIDYNQMKYLMETRCSGTLVKPHSAVAVEFVAE